MTASSRQNVHAAKFLVSCVAVLALSFVLSATQPLSWYHSNEVNFAEVTPTQVVAVNGLLEDQYAPVKLDWAVAPGSQVNVGLYGHHVVRAFSSKAFGDDTPPGFFFNYTLEHLFLPDVLDMLKRQAAAGTLPNKILIYLSQPYLGPIPMTQTTLAGIGDRSRGWMNRVNNSVGKVRKRLDWQGVAAGMISWVSPGCYRWGPIDAETGLSNLMAPPWAASLRGMIGAQAADDLLQAYRNRCQMADVLRDGVRGYRRDGSAVGWPVEVHNNDVSDPVPWSADDIERAFTTLSEIEALARQNHRSVLYFVPPHKGLNKPIPGDAAFGDMLRRLRQAGMDVHDYRAHYKPGFMFDDRHVNDEFFRLMVEEQKLGMPR